MTLRKYIGSRAFYRQVCAVAFPSVMTQLITTFVSLLDNVMISSVSTEALVGVSIVSQFMMIFQCAIFGAVGAAGIFTAQYFGKKDVQGVVFTVRFKLILNLACALIGIGVFLLFGDTLIASFLHESDDVGDLALAMRYAKEYLAVMLIGLVPFSLSQAYSATMRETGELRVPMCASIIAVISNTVGNAILIFGLFGIPPMGALGAAISTVLARLLEFSILAVYAHTKKERCPWANKAVRGVYLPLPLFAVILRKAIPLMVSEFFWSLAVTLCNQCYSMRGIEAVASQTIVSTVQNLMNAVVFGVGVSITIVVGNLLGANEIKAAEDSARKMRALAVAIGMLAGVWMVVLSPALPALFSETGRVASLATYMLIIAGISMPMIAYSQSAYFTLRTGGKVLHTFLFDTVFMWGCVVPAAWILAYLTDAPIETIYAVCVLLEIFKSLIGALLVRYVKWANHLVGEPSDAAAPEPEVIL